MGFDDNITFYALKNETTEKIVTYEITDPFDGNFTVTFDEDFEAGDEVEVYYVIDDDEELTSESATATVGE